jgi:uncharacterized protein YdhG (YjbR/CyaY superfamily)
MNVAPGDTSRKGTPAMPATKTTPRNGATGKTANVWSDVERAAMKESARERKAASRIPPAEERAAGEADIRAKIAEMTPAERAMAERIHEIVGEAAPDLVPRTYYGMPAYAKAGRVICFFQPASKFKVRYSTFGFQPDARLDDGELWPIAFALTELTAAGEARIAALVKQAAG